MLKALRSRNHQLNVLGGCLLIALVGASFGWSLRTIYAPTTDLSRAPSYALVRAVQGDVGRSIRLSATASWSGGTVFPNQISGVVTKTHIRGVQTVTAGQALYDVNLIPVRIAVGTVPAFRSLRQGAIGQDVSQLQNFLAAAGTRHSAATGEYDATTASEVSAWQRSVGREPIGEVPLGELLFVPKLPARVALGTGIKVAAAVSPVTLTPGPSNDVTVAGILSMPSSPTFSITLPPEQARIVSPGMSVSLRVKDAVWQAVVDNVSEAGEDGNAVARLAPKAGMSICGTACDIVPIEGTTGIDGTIAIVSKINGTVVPNVALVVGSDGSAAVVLKDGQEVAVTVEASAGGRVVVRGIRPGTSVRVAAASRS